MEYLYEREKERILIQIESSLACDREVRPTSLATFLHPKAGPRVIEGEKGSRSCQRVEIRTWIRDNLQANEHMIEGRKEGRWQGMYG